MVGAPVSPRRRAIGRIKPFIRIQGQDDVYEGLIEGLDEICVIVCSRATVNTVKTHLVFK
jgi:hypothetical protein